MGEHLGWPGRTQWLYLDKRPTTIRSLMYQSTPSWAPRKNPSELKLYSRSPKIAGFAMPAFVVKRSATMTTPVCAPMNASKERQWSGM
jgi:hypothetical protein